LSLRIAAVIFVALGASLAQQPNTPNASMVVNGVSGPPYPITGVTLPVGLIQNVVVSSVATNAPFVLFGAPSLYANGWPVLGGELLDVNIGAGAFVLADGVANPAVFNTGAGAFVANLLLPVTATIGTQTAFQCLVADPSAPSGARLTAATDTTVSPGLTVLTLATPNDGGVPVDFTAYGFTFPYYASNWTRIFVNNDGNVTFGGASTNFTPSPAAFQFHQPRIAPMWSDLDRSFPGASITATINPGVFAGPATVTIDWIAMAEWNNIGARHTFQLVMNAVTGDLTFNHPTSNVATIADQFVGITPGQNLLPPSGVFAPFRNLSTLPGAPQLGPPNDAFWEWFGTVGGFAPTYTQGFTNPWDMAGTTTTFTAIGAGAPGAAYNGN